MSYFRTSSTEENEALLPDPEERYLPNRFYSGQLSDISEGDNEVSGTFHSSLPSSQQLASDKNAAIRPELDNMIRTTRSSLQVNSVWDRVRRHVRPQTFAFLHVVAATILLTAFMVFLPLYTGGLATAGSDSYVGCLMVMMWIPVAFFILLGLIKAVIHRKIPVFPTISWPTLVSISAPWSLSLLMVMYTTPPVRLPVHLQPILTSLLLPVAAIARYIIIKKGVSRLQVLCLALQAGGAFVAVWPVIFQLQEKRTGMVWFYVLLFIISWIPGVASFVYATKCLSDRRAHTFSILPWTQLLVAAAVPVMFWTNLIPALGMVRNFKDYTDHIQSGFSCFYQGGHSDSCSDIPARAALFILTYTFGFSTLLVILRFKDGLSYFAVIIGLASLLATVFWSVFLDAYLNEHFSPRIEEGDSVYLFVGIGIVALAFASFIYLGFIPPPEPPSPPSRRRRTSSSRASFSLSGKKHTLKKSRSAPNFNIYL